MNQIVYRPGAWQVVVDDGGVIAVPADVAPERIVRLARMLEGGAPALTEVIDVLSGGSITTLGSFAVALSSGDGVRFAVRGPVGVRLAGAGDEFSGADVTTWSERFVVEAEGFELSLGDDAGSAEYPIRSGIVLAGAVRAGAAAASADESVPEAEPSGGDAAGAPGGGHPEGGAEAEENAAAAEDAAAVTETDDAADAENAGIPSTADGTRFADATPSAGESAVAAAEPADAQDAAQSAPADDGSAPDEAGAAPDDVQHTLVPDDLTYAPAAEETVHVTPPPPTAPLLSTPPAPPAAPAPPALGNLGDHDGATISLAEARRLRAGTSAPDAPTAVLPTVDAPAATNGRVRLSTGQVVELDRPVIIGRRPRSTRASGDSMPHLVAVESPQQDISRSHLEIRPEGDSVVVIDLHTTNGSTLIRPGTDPVRLHPGEHTLVLDGDTVDLGDGVTLSFEGLT
ncbi:FHA domain-containing protein [Microbacterium sp.]|uniref:FHA domain-containing protein n=1 Tax=Microbacterium sp. TaxID=51671 RepID=UPI0028116030|nr:FHA domain-containing protein [Microbacterium sp.]